jgi:hypothetical protein
VAASTSKQVQKTPQDVASQAGARLVKAAARYVLEDPQVQKELRSRQQILFRGTVTKVTRSGLGPDGSLSTNTVRVRRTGQGVSDPIDYPVYDGQYVPAVGDDVLLVAQGKTGAVIGTRSGGRPGALKTPVHGGQVSVQTARGQVLTAFQEAGATPGQIVYSLDGVTPRQQLRSDGSHTGTGPHRQVAKLSPSTGVAQGPKVERVLNVAAQRIESYLAAHGQAPNSAAHQIETKTKYAHQKVVRGKGGASTQTGTGTTDITGVTTPTGHGLLEGDYQDNAAASQYIDTPTDAPQVSTDPPTYSTALAAGDYQVTYTFTNASGETPAAPAATVTIEQGQQIVVPALAMPQGATSINVYLSSAAGSSTLYLLGAWNGQGPYTCTALPGTTTQPPSSNTTVQVASPTSAPPCTVQAGGTVPIGVYNVAYAWEMSGGLLTAVSPLTQVTVTSNTTALQISGLPALPAGAVAINYYCSPANAGGTPVALAWAGRQQAVSTFTLSAPPTGAPSWPGYNQTGVPTPQMALEPQAQTPDYGTSSTLLAGTYNACYVLTNAYGHTQCSPGIYPPGVTITAGQYITLGPVDFPPNATGITWYFSANGGGVTTYQAATGTDGSAVTFGGSAPFVSAPPSTNPQPPSTNTTPTFTPNPTSNLVVQHKSGKPAIKHNSIKHTVHSNGVVVHQHDGTRITEWDNTAVQFGYRDATGHYHYVSGTIRHKITVASSGAGGAVQIMSGDSTNFHVLGDEGDASYSISLKHKSGYRVVKHDGSKVSLFAGGQDSYAVITHDGTTHASYASDGTQLHGFTKTGHTWYMWGGKQSAYIGEVGASSGAVFAAMQEGTANWHWWGDDSTGKVYVKHASGNRAWDHDGTTQQVWGGGQLAHKLFNGGQIAYYYGNATVGNVQIYSVGGWAPFSGNSYAGSIISLQQAGDMSTSTKGQVHVVGDDQGGRIHARHASGNKAWDHDGNTHNVYSAGALTHQFVSGGGWSGYMSGQQFMALGTWSGLNSGALLSLVQQGGVSSGTYKYHRVGADNGGTTDFTIMHATNASYAYRHTGVYARHYSWNTTTSAAEEVMNTFSTNAISSGTSGGRTAHKVHGQSIGGAAHYSGDSGDGNQYLFSNSQIFKYTNANTTGRKYTYNNDIFYGTLNQNINFNASDASEIFFVPQGTSRGAGNGAIKQFSHSVGFTPVHTPNVTIPNATTMNTIPSGTNPGGGIIANVAAVTGHTNYDAHFKILSFNFWYITNTGVYSDGKMSFYSNYGWGRDTEGSATGLAAWTSYSPHADTSYKIEGASYNNNTWVGDVTVFYSYVN